MSASNQMSCRVLFVDDDIPFLETVKELMATYSNGQWDVLTAPSASQAFAILQDQSVDLAVVDVQMPVMDGMQMLSLLNRGYPNLQKVVLTGFGSDKYRTACLSNGAELFLEKPKSSEEWHSVYATLNELLKWGRPQPVIVPGKSPRPDPRPTRPAFRGVMRRVELTEVIQLECTERHSCVVEVQSGASTGRIYIRAGAIVHAVAGGKSGLAALQTLLSQRGAEFKLAAFAEPPAETLDGPWEELLAGATPGNTTAQTPDVASAPRQSEIAAVMKSAAAAGNLVPSVSAERPTVESFLLCSERGDVLYEWQCRDTDVWVKFLEFVSQKSQRLAQGIMLGDFDRLEILADKARIIVIVASDRGVMIRTRRSEGGQGSDVSASATGRLAVSKEAKEQFGQWLRRAPSARGVLVRGVRFPDQTMVCDLDSRDFPGATLEQAVRSVADTFQVLIAHQVVPFRLTWIYSRASLHCARRRDGAIFAAVALTKSSETDVGGLDHVLSDFCRQNMPAR